MARLWALFLLILSPVESYQCAFMHKKYNRISSALLESLSEDKHSVSSILVPPFAPTTDEEDEYPSYLHYIYVQPLFNDEEAAEVSRIAHEYAEETGCWDRPDKERHASYATCDFPVEDSEKMENYLQDIGFDDRIFGLLSEKYGVDTDDLEYLDLFCAHYRGKTTDNRDVMDRLEAHRDGSLLSFTVTLTPPGKFTGGGTFFDALLDVPSESSAMLPGGVVRPPRAGDVVLHSGKLLHGADVVTSGERTVLVGFVDVDIWKQRPGALSDACRDWGRMDVATNRYQRQVEKISSGSKAGWHMNNDRWVDSSSALRGFCPAFGSVRRRADPASQRIQKLVAEDRLLRHIMLTQEELRDGSFLGGDVTIL